MIKQKDSFEELFGNTYIGRNKTPLANSYYILHLNLSGLDTRDAERLEATFGAYVKEEIKKFIEYYELDLVLEDNDFVSYTNSFLSRLHLITDKLFIIIDEYDHFANSLIGSTNEFESATNKDGFVRNFYEVLKKHTNHALERIFITDVTSLAMDSLTSGCNITKNLSQRWDLNCALGFTLEEVTALADYLEIPNKEKTLNVLYEYI